MKIALEDEKIVGQATIKGKSETMLELTERTERVIKRIDLGVAQEQGTVQLPFSRGIGIRFIDKRFFPMYECLVCGKKLLDRTHVNEHRKTCEYNIKDYETYKKK